MNSFKRISFLLLFLLLSTNLFAQKSSGWAMVFTWDRFNAGEFPVSGLKLNPNTNDISNMGGIGLEYKLTYQWALQVGLAFGTESDELSTTQGTVTTTEENSQTHFGIAVAPLFYFRGYDVTGVRPYIGGRLSFGSFSATEEMASGTNKITEELSASSIGFAVFGGADVELISGLRVGAGYGLGFSSFPESEREVTSATAGSSTTNTIKGPSSSEFNTFFHMSLKLLF
jgi:opacity protein-like surface antigen